MTTKSLKRYLMFVILALTIFNVKGADIKQELDSLFNDRFTDAYDQPGGAILIAKGDSIIYERYYGIADMSTGAAIDAETRFNIASVSKQFTVVVLLQQCPDIDVPLSEYFSYTQPFWHQVTPRHLASHTSGIPDSRDRSDRNKCIYATDSTSVMYFSTVDTLKFKPGTAYDYLNPSFILLAQIAEKESGQDFITYMQQHVFDRLNMDNTYYFDPKQDRPNTAHGYQTNDDGHWVEFDYGEETFFATRPDGGIYSTPRDMLKWEIGLATGQMLPPELLKQAYSPQIEVYGSPWCDYQNRPDTWYGLGWFIEHKSGGPVKVYHTGDNGGFQAYVAKYPELGYSIIVLENRHDKDRWQMAEAIDRILINGH